MGLTWLLIAISGLVALAMCLGFGLLKPAPPDHRRYRILANVERLTRLPEYRKAMRRRTLTAIVTVALLVTAFGASVLAAARPTGLPGTSRNFSPAQPEDIMLCMGGSLTDPATRAALQYFAGRVRTFSTERIAVTTVDRRVVPMTRDYQYVAARLDDYAASSARQSAQWATAISYSDYARDVADVLALCLTGFPGFEHKGAQRRSLIYVGPGTLRAPNESRPALYTVDEVRDMAAAAGAQINVVVTGPMNSALASLASATDGIASNDSDITARLAEIRSHAPSPSPTENVTSARLDETPNVPVLVALTALAVLILWSVGVRR